jgi:hypothetical protein
MIAWCAPGRAAWAAAALLLAGEPLADITIEETPHLPDPATVILAPEPVSFLPDGPVELKPPPRPALHIPVNEPLDLTRLGGI